MMSEIMDVPFPRAASRRLMSFLTFQISMFFSASLGCSFFPDMVAVGWWLCWRERVGSRDFLEGRGAGEQASKRRRKGTHGDCKHAFAECRWQQQKGVFAADGRG